MIRRTFLQSLLGALGLAAAPKVQAAPVVAPFPVPFRPLGPGFPDNYCLTFTHQHEPKVDYYNDVVVYGMRDGRPICQLIVQHAIITERTYGAAAKDLKGVIVWESPPPYRTEVEVSLSGLFGPAPLMATLASIFGDVVQAVHHSLVLVVPEQKQRVDLSYAVLSNIGAGVGAAGGTMWTGAKFLVKSQERKDDQWQAADLEFLPLRPNEIRSVPQPLTNLGYDWKVEQQRLLDEQLGQALR